MSKHKDLVDFTVFSMKYETKLTKKYVNRKAWEAPNPNNILSYIPGTIISIDVKEGQEVKEGERLLILEAMKMRNNILMPFDGKIAKIHVGEGDRLPKNHLMIEVE